MTGIKETKEVVVAVNEISLLLISRLKDGVQLGDAIAVFDALKNDAEFQHKIISAYGNIAAVPAEVKDVDLSEAVELIALQAAYIPKIVASLKKE